METNINNLKLSYKDNFRLGYACINMGLREKKIFTSRTCRISTIEKNGIEYLKELSIKNIKDLLTILQWNKENGIYFMRISSDLFPFASHDKYGYSLDFADELLKKIGKYINENKMRITFHPGQFNVLNSLDEKIVKNTINDLNIHCEILDRMNIDKDGVIIIHGGGIYGNKKKSLERLKENIKKLPNKTKNRLVLENCEMAYTVEELLYISEELNIPIVIDFHHDSINPSSNSVEFYFDRIFTIWNNRNIKPKVHVSNSIPGVKETDSKTLRRKHSDYIEYFHKSLLNIDLNIDIMLECKEKERAVLRIIQ